MTGFFDWLFAFIARVLAVPELHAITVASFAGIAITYLLQLPLPMRTPVKVAVQWARVWIFLVVLGVAFYQVRTFVMFAWAASFGLLMPLFYEWIGAIIFHRYPWLKPRALKTGADFGRVDDTEHA